MKKIVYISVTACFIFFTAVSFSYSEKIQGIIQSANSTDSMFAVDKKDTASDDTYPEKTDYSDSDKSYYAIQIAIFQKEDQANQTIIKLKDDGFNPYIFQSINSNNQTIYAVRIGRYSDIDSANKAAITFENKLSQPVLVTTYGSLTPAVTVSSKKAVTTDQPLPLPGPTQSPQNQDTESYFTEKNDLQSNDSPRSGSIINDSASFQLLQKKIEILEAQINQIQGESEVRQHLKGSEEEEKTIKEQQADILEDVDRRYTLRQAGQISFDLGLSYSHSTYDAIRQQSRVEDTANHTISTSLGVYYGLKDNLTVGFNIPFNYKYHIVGTIQSKEATGLGDLKLSWQYQPLATNANLPSIILHGDFSVPVGPSPYEIQYGEELSTSSGVISAGIGASISQVVDPVVIFTSISVDYPFTVTDVNQKRNESILDEVDQGIAMGIGFGFGAAISPEINFNMNVGYSYSFETEYKYQNAPDTKTGIGAGASLSMGFGYKYYKNYKTNFNIRFPLTSTGSYSIAFNTPIRFDTRL